MIRISTPQVTPLANGAEICFPLEITTTRHLNHPEVYEITYSGLEPDFLDTEALDAALVGLFSVAVAQEMDLKLDGPISPRLAYGLQEALHILESWNSISRPINIHYDQFLSSRSTDRSRRQERAEASSQTALLYRGDPQSVYCLHRPSTPQPWPIKYLVRVDALSSPAPRVSTPFNSRPIQLSAKSNGSDFIDALGDGMVEQLKSCFEVAPLLPLSPMVHHCIIPSVFSWPQLTNYTPVHPLLTPLYSNEYIRFTQRGDWIEVLDLLKTVDKCSKDHNNGLSWTASGFTTHSKAEPSRWPDLELCATYRIGLALLNGSSASEAMSAVDIVRDASQYLSYPLLSHTRRVLAYYLQEARRQNKTNLSKEIRRTLLRDRVRNYFTLLRNLAGL